MDKSCAIETRGLCVNASEMASHYLEKLIFPSLNLKYFITYYTESMSHSNLNFSGKCSLMCLCFSNEKIYGCSRSQRARAALLGLAHNPTDSSCSTTDKHHLTQYFKKQQLSLGEVLPFPTAPTPCIYNYTT